VYPDRTSQLLRIEESRAVSQHPCTVRSAVCDSSDDSMRRIHRSVDYTDRLFRLEKAALAAETAGILERLN
jgi:hypothetical protein